MWELDHKEGWVPKSLCFRTVVLQKTLEHPLDSKEIKPVNPKGNQPWIFSGRTDAKAEALIFWPPDSKSPPTHWKIPWCWERLRAGGDGDNRGWDGWMALPTRWTWVWASSGRQWRTGRPGVLQSVGLQRVGHSWATEKQQWKVTNLGWDEGLSELRSSFHQTSCLLVIPICFAAGDWLSM